MPTARPANRSSRRHGRGERVGRTLAVLCGLLVLLGVGVGARARAATGPGVSADHARATAAAARRDASTWAVSLVSSPAIGGGPTLSSPRYRLTVRSEPTWVVTITPDRDQLSIPGRVTTNTAPLVALRAAAAAAVPPAQMAGRSELVRSPWRPRARWEDRVCPG